MISKNDKILVTGGAGFIGSHLVDLLLKEGFSVRVIDNLVNGRLANIEHHFENPKFEFYRGSITDPFDVKETVKGVSAIYHLACLGVRHSLKHPFENHRVNAEGTLYLLEEARNTAVKKFIYCSTSEVYGTAINVPMPENHPTNPNTVYGASKLAGEKYTQAYNASFGLQTVVIRPFNTFGPRSHHEGDAGELIPKTIVRAMNGLPLLVFGNGLQTRDFTFVEDTARGFLLALNNEKLVGKILNMGSNFEITVKETVETIRNLIGNEKSEIQFTKDRPGDVLRLYADSTEFRNLTGWTPKTEMKDGLTVTSNWFKNRGETPGQLIKQEVGFNWE